MKAALKAAEALGSGTPPAAPLPATDGVAAAEHDQAESAAEHAPSAAQSAGGDAVSTGGGAAGASRSRQGGGGATAAAGGAGAGGAGAGGSGQAGAAPAAVGGEGNAVQLQHGAMADKKRRRKEPVAYTRTLRKRKQVNYTDPNGWD